MAAPAAGASVVLGIDVGVSKSVVAFGEGGATAFGADLVRAAAAHWTCTLSTLALTPSLSHPARSLHG
jgi:hypothetical protein